MGRKKGPLQAASFAPVVRQLPNKPLQQTNATRVRSRVGSCRDAAGCARGSSRPWYARTRPWRSLLNGRSLAGQTMPYGFFKKKLRRGQSYPLKRSLLDAALLVGAVMDEVGAVHYWEWSSKAPTLRVSFTGEDRKGLLQRGVSSITVYAVPSAERKVIEQVLVAQGLPQVVGWLARVAASGNTVRGPNQTLTLSVREGRLESKSSLVSNREDPLQVSGDIVNTRPSGTKPR